MLGVVSGGELVMVLCFAGFVLVLISGPFRPRRPSPDRLDHRRLMQEIRRHTE